MEGPLERLGTTLGGGSYSYAVALELAFLLLLIVVDFFPPMLAALAGGLLARRIYDGSGQRPEPVVGPVASS